MAETRKLAAILAADVVGFSRLAGADEDRTLARLRALRSDLIDPTIAVHHGRVVKRTGDGILIEFRSVVDAVRCAIELQNGMVERNSGLPPERRIEFRVGIHLGDVVEESDGDLMGDGVNIAARLEGIAKPGTICLSEDAYRQVKARLDLEVSDLGAQSLKNIAEPVRVYLLEVGKSAQAPTKPAAPKRRLIVVLLVAGIAALVVIAAGIWLVVRPARGPETSTTTPQLSVVVLPFANLSGDSSQDYLADALTEELTTSLSRIAGSFVIARSTAFTYKGKTVGAKQIGKDLGVRYILEGSAQPSGNRVRISAQLISAETDAHLWANQFDADRADLLQMQDEIVTHLARVLEIQLWKVDAARVARARPINPSAEDLALQCLSSNYSNVFRDAPSAYEYGLCDGALQIDPRNALALAIMAWKFVGPVLEGQSSDPQGDIRRADQFVTQAIAVEPNLYIAHRAKAWVLFSQKRPEEALVEAERSLALNPGFTEIYPLLCLANYTLGRPERALELADKAIRLSPRDPKLPLLYWQKALSYFMMQRDEQAIEWMRRTLAAWPEWPMGNVLFAATLALSGNEAEARETLKHYLSLNNVKMRTISAVSATLLSQSFSPSSLASAKRFSEGLGRAGMPEK
jgi:adenylate cyclase